MIKMIIIDDEAYACDLFTEIMDWKELGFSIEGVFYTSRSAMKFLKNNFVDVVFTDIKMPEFSGIEIAEFCRKIHPKTKFVFISAHRNFNFAQKALQLSVIDYIVKPIVYGQLEACITHIKELMNKSSITPNFIDTELSLYRQQFFCDYISDIAHDDTDSEYIFNRMKIDISTLEYQCGIVEIKISNFESKVLSGWNYQQDEIYTAIRQMLPSETEDYYFILISKLYNRMQFLMLLKNERLMFDTVFEAFVRMFNDDASKCIGTNVEFSVKKQAKRLKELYGIMSLKQLTSKKVESIFSQLICGDTKEAKINIASIFKIYSDDFSEVKYFCEELIRRLNEAQIIAQVKTEDVKECDLEGLKKIIDKYVVLCENKTAETKKVTNEIILKAIEYINENFNKDISLDDVASHVALNPRYFCTYFKKNMGESFVDYLIKVRIENAKKIIDENDDMKTSLLYEYVGYKSAPYFYKIFKSYTGMTPSEYKAREAEEESEE